MIFSRTLWCCLITLSLCLLSTGCDKPADKTPPKEASSTGATIEQTEDHAQKEKEGAHKEGDHEHAQAGVKPGSHEDWCGGHQVPESLCTRCNPELASAFKATGDWCKEHDLPESQCLKCNPELKIERPPKAAEDAP